ncbi:MAG TPA: SDR family NAD(P)-dependent oxidoreductase [Candidatus Angelobacter sp.]|jgi:NAD(P)-dependent dehydrogenase (short-subunit alcohol dehydrogenase family)|nr:SDR family NAD(P)-dependent oxidoreductase [Candidatus Angelobacter sp.]
MPNDATNFASYPSLRGRVVLITGGASGIGEAIVEAFAAQHAKVAFLDIQDDAAEPLLRRLTEAGHPAPLFLHCDLTDTDAARAAVSRVAEALGDIDVLVNNAGNDTRHNIEDVTPELWDRLIAVNLKQQFFMCQAVIPSMRRLGRGSIIDLSSIAWAIPSTNVPVYVTAKAAIVGMTRTLAHELGPANIRVNCVMPGAILTQRQRRLWLTETYQAEVLGRQALKRLLQPDEVARLILFLASDDSSAITNQSHVVDGGWI